MHRGMKRTLNKIARNKFDEAAADRRHRENPHGDKVREVSAAFAVSRPPRFEARATLPGIAAAFAARRNWNSCGPGTPYGVTHTHFAIVPRSACN
jgi:hypothetical protein